MLRGMLYLEVTLHGLSHDLHSGMYGGAVLNPINALTRILGQIHDDQGRVQFPGFYDAVQPLSDAEREQWRGLGFDEAGFLAGVGLKTPRGEAGWSTLERIWARPTCDINGIWGGYTGAGSKTVIPAQASAKFSCRLVASQDPTKILAGIKEFLESRTPPDARWEIKTFSNSPAIKVPVDSPHLQRVMTGLADIYGKPPVLIGAEDRSPSSAISSGSWASTRSWWDSAWKTT